MAAPARRALVAAGIEHLDDFGRFSEADVLALHGMGANAMAKLKLEMAARGARFASD